jgi:hypothetical protein
MLEGPDYPDSSVRGYVLLRDFGDQVMLKKIGLAVRSRSPLSQFAE